MPWEVLSWFRRNRKEAHEAIFDLDQGVVAERRASAAYRDLAEVAEENLQTLARLVEASRTFEGGDEVVAEAARVYREGLAALIATPTHLYPTDAASRREAIESPSVGSTNSQPLPVDGPPGGSSRKALPNGAISPDAAPDSSSLPPTTPPRRPRGRPPGSRSKPKPRLSLPTTEGEDDGRA